MTPMDEQRYGSLRGWPTLELQFLRICEARIGQDKQLLPCIDRELKRRGIVPAACEEVRHGE